MGFPRILSKNNKIYTKLGEFCLSGDGNQFWIVCHTCQEELQTQDHFWKHIQDEHNFLHGMKQDQNRSSTVSFIEADMPALPLPLYRKVEDAQRMGADQDDDDDSQEQQEPKDYTEMRAIEPSASAVEIDIKVEPISQPLPPPPPAQAHLVNATPTSTLYQLPQVPPAGASTYAGIAHTPPVSLMPALSMSVLAAAAPPPPAAMMVASHLPHELPKDSNSTTASASSAVSSDDGERWYICDYETCGLKFKYQSRLELHRSVHSKERRFACELCGASFKQSCNLSTHRKKKHFLKGTKGLVQQRY